MEAESYIENGPVGQTEPNGLVRFLQRVVDVRPHEISALLMACGYFFCLLSSYYILRPIRDEIGVAGGVNNLPWLFTGTLVATLVANPIFSTLVVKFPVKRFITFTYLFFIGNLIVFYGLLKILPHEKTVWVSRAFFVWISVFNLFVVSIFWAFMADVFHSSQGKRLFGFIGGGGTLGAIVGSSITAILAQKIGTMNLFLVSIALLCGCLACVFWFPTHFTKDETRSKEKRETHYSENPIGGGVWAGIIHTSKSPYLLGICAYILLFTIGSTFLYFQQTSIVGAAFQDRGARTAFLARLDLMVNVLTIVTQLFLTGRIIKWLGVSLTLAFLPLMSMFGFIGLGAMPLLAVFVGFHVLRRAGNFGVSGAVREVLFTVVSREDKYKAKNFIDTFVYRSGDQIGAWSNGLLGWIGLSTRGIAWAAVPIALIWLGLGFWLGRKQKELASQEGIPVA